MKAVYKEFRALETRTKAFNASLEATIHAVGDLPASPAIVSAVMGLTSDLNASVTDISQVLSSDQSLTAKVLKLSNSSFYGRSKDVKTLQEAILILGFFTVRSLVIATSAHSMYMEEDTDGSKVKLWRHSLSAAVAAREIASRIKHPDKEEVFIATLLHDIGKLVLLQKMPVKYTEIVARVEKDRRSFVDEEVETLGFTHCDVAALLLDKWSFPTSMIAAIQFHHALPEVEQGQPVPIAFIVSLGNHIAKTINVGFDDHQVEVLSDLPEAQALSLDEDDIAEIAENFEQHYRSELNIFEGK